MGKGIADQSECVKDLGDRQADNDRLGGDDQAKSVEPRTERSAPCETPKSSLCSIERRR
jgi:hypothetical protein